VDLSSLAVIDEMLVECNKQGAYLFFAGQSQARVPTWPSAPCRMMRIGESPRVSRLDMGMRGGWMTGAIH
jgi:hypothetical protein